MCKSFDETSTVLEQRAKESGRCMYISICMGAEVLDMHVYERIHGGGRAITQGGGSARYACIQAYAFVFACIYIYRGVRGEIETSHALG